MRGLWNQANYEIRYTMLSKYYKSKSTIEKHIKKDWTSLPQGFKTFIKKNNEKIMLGYYKSW